MATFPHSPLRRAARIVLPALALGLLPAAHVDPEAIDTLVAAERSFAADAGRIGVTPAFRAHAGEGAVLFRPNPADAQRILAEQRDAAGLTLAWQPAMAVVARSGDLGVTSGPYVMRVGADTVRGHFLTVWQRRAEGGWRWVLDQGIVTGPGSPVLEIPQVRMLAAPASGPGSAAALAMAEAALNARLLAKGTGASVSALLAADGQVMRQAHAPAPAGPAADVLLAADPRFDAATPLASHMSRSGDLAYSYGGLRSGASVSHYVRIWRHEPAGWRLLIDQIVPVPAVRQS